MALVSCLVVVGAAVLLSVVCCLLSVVCCLLFAVCCSLFADCCLLSAVCCSLFVACCLLFAVCCLLLAVCCSLFAVCCSLFVVCSLSSAVCCLLSVVCCLLLLSVHYLFVVCSPSVHFHFAVCSFSVHCLSAVAPEVFSKRQPLIFSHYLCVCGSFFPHVSGIYVRPPSVLLPSAIRKVPGETAFLHHLLEFVMGRPAPGVSLASPAREPHPEGAGRNGFSPPPSRIRYRPTCPRCFSRQPYPGCPSERCRRKCRLPVTFLSGV